MDKRYHPVKECQCKHNRRDTAGYSYHRHNSFRLRKRRQDIQTDQCVTSAFTGSFVGTTIGTLLAQNLQDLVVDAVYGTVLTGSIQTSVVGVEPRTGVKTSTIVAGSWFAGTLVTGQRL